MPSHYVHVAAGKRGKQARQVEQKREDPSHFKVYIKVVPQN